MIWPGSRMGACRWRPRRLDRPLTANSGSPEGAPPLPAHTQQNFHTSISSPFTALNQILTASLQLMLCLALGSLYLDLSPQHLQLHTVITHPQLDTASP